MLRYIKFLFFLVAVSCLSGCYTDFEPSLKSTPVVCINSLLTAGEEIRVEVTRTWRYSEGSPVVDLDIDLRDAKVDLFVNDRFEETLVFTADSLTSYWDPKYYYAARYIPRSGDKIRIHASDPTYGEAEAETVVPFPVEIDNVDVVVKSNDYDYDPEADTFRTDFELLLRVTFTDPADQTDSYMMDMKKFVYVLYEREEDGWSVPMAESIYVTPDYGFDPIFSEHITPIETVITDAYGLYTMFSDRQFAGRTFTLEIPVNGVYFYDYANHPDPDNHLTLDITLEHISQAYYRYMLSLWAATEGVSGALGDVGLGDVVFESSNVSTGAGIVAAQAPGVFSLDLHDILVGQR